MRPCSPVLTHPSLAMSICQILIATAVGPAIGNRGGWGAGSGSPFARELTVAQALAGFPAAPSQYRTFASAPVSVSTDTDISDGLGIEHLLIPLPTMDDSPHDSLDLGERGFASAFDGRGVSSGSQLREGGAIERPELTLF
jgi:hypothetical protein